jgi:PAS domain S-box-containing protein
LFQSLDIGAAGIIAIYRSDDFKRVVRWPPGDGKLNAQLPPDSPTRTALAPGNKTATVEISSAADGITRIYGYSILDSYPFFVSVGAAHNDVLAAWKALSLAVGVRGLLLCLLLIGLLHRLLRVEESLIANEELMRSTFEQAAVGIAHISPDTFRILSVNETFCHLPGYTQDELIGTEPRVLTSADEMPAREADRASILAGAKKNVRRRTAPDHERRRVIVGPAQPVAGAR